ncbi:carbohydrate kinase [Scandinavium sp. H11S7]|uniref:Carbohydrate kinase n=1 Tax=Scandinavium hiltneri TaxID=2926519 RepID=A0ABT2E501_9ENTR|nr:carbohydrate kinase [Scandinavium hiltneri]MCS2162952.1 carbohydrate kinase [Scandinavium hiltneri]
MHRIDTPTAQKDKFGAGKNGFTRGNPQTGTPATDLDDDYFDMLQEELAGVVEATGASLDKAKHNQLLTALKGLLLSRVHPFADIKADGAAAIAEALANLGLGDGSGRLVGIKRITTSGTYTPTPGTNAVLVHAVGGGGGGGGCAANAAGNASVGQGGGAGAYGESRYTTGFSGVSVVIGSAGSAGAAGPSGVGGSGGDTSFGTLLVCQGGPGGKPGASLTPPSLGESATPNTSTVTGANIVSFSGESGASGFIFSSNNNTGMVSGCGGSGRFGSGGSGSSVIGTVNAASGYGAGGGGAISSSAGSAQPGAAGSQGLVVILEYA